MPQRRTCRRAGVILIKKQRNGRVPEAGDSSRTEGWNYRMSMRSRSRMSSPRRMRSGWFTALIPALTNHEIEDIMMLPKKATEMGRDSAPRIAAKSPHPPRRRGLAANSRKWRHKKNGCLTQQTTI